MRKIQVYIRENISELVECWENFVGYVEFMGDPASGNSKKVNRMLEDVVKVRPELWTYGFHSFSTEHERFNVAARMLSDGQLWRDIEKVTFINEAKYRALEREGGGKNN